MRGKCLFKRGTREGGAVTIYNVRGGDHIDNCSTLSVIGQSIAEILRQTKPGALNMINKAIPHLFGSPKSVFVTTTPHEILFDGVTVNCSKSTEFAANTMCDQLRLDPRGLIPHENDTFKFSIFGFVSTQQSVNRIGTYYLR